MAVQDVLSARLEVKDSFTSKLSTFITKTNNAEKAFEKFINNTDKSARILEKTFDVLDKKIDSVITKLGAQTEVMNNKIANSAKKVEQSQTKAISNLASKYGKMGQDVQGIFKTINKDAETLAKSGIKLSLGGGNGDSNNKGKGHNHGGGSNVLGDGERAFGSLLSGNFEMMAMQLGIIGGAVLGVSKILSTIDNSVQQGFNVLNNLSGNLLSYDGLKEGLQNAGQFETNRVAMDVLYGNDSTIGQKYYAMGTKLAKDTPYSESDLGTLQKKLAGAKINYTQDQLMTILDIASIKPELGADHVGFSIVDAMAGRSTSLKTNYMLDNKEINKYLQSLKKSSNSEDRTNAKKWKDAFNKTGTVNNKQEYLDLLVDYVRKETKYTGLTKRYSETLNGLIDRIKGQWETVEADLLGIDANGTGMAKSGTNVFNSIKNFLEYMDDWLQSSTATNVLGKLGTGLGTGVDSITKSIEKTMKKINWDNVGSTFEKVGDSIAKVVDKITSSPQFSKLLEELPDIIEKIITSKALQYVSDTNSGSKYAQGDVVGGMYSDFNGYISKTRSNLGAKDALDTYTATQKIIDEESDRGTVGNWEYNASQLWSQLGSATKSLWNISMSPYDNPILTDANASTYLAQNPNLNDDQRDQIKNMINDDNQAKYNITIHEIRADNFDEIMQSIQQVQANQK
jgi:hypothetical protein